METIKGNKFDVYNDNGYITVDHPGSACVLPLIADGYFLLTKQFRRLTLDGRNVDTISIEIPAGIMDVAGESPLSCAIRELEEETGYSSKNIAELSWIFPSLGYTNERMNLFVAKDLYEGNKIDSDDDDIHNFVCSHERAKEYILNGVIRDAKTIVSILTYFQFGHMLRFEKAN